MGTNDGNGSEVRHWLGGFKQWNTDAVEIIEWLSENGYRAYRSGTTAAGKRVCYFKKEGCKTTYAIHC